MTDPDTTFLPKGATVRLRTVLLIRWIAIAGHLTTVLIVHFGFGYSLPLTMCGATIVLLAISNFTLSRLRSTRGRLTDSQALAILGFDALQLTCMLYLTGGLANPFGILILAPVVVSATILSRRATVTLTALALLATTFLAYYHLPLPWDTRGLTLSLPYILGIWTALAVAIVFIATYVWLVADEARRMLEALSETQSELVRAKSLAALDGLAAAAAHELGSPLATIAVVANELSREISEGSPLANDVKLLISESMRCREILADIAAQPEDRGSVVFERLPISLFLEEAVQSARNSTMEVSIDVLGRIETEPALHPQLGILRGLGNLIQNAQQYAKTCITIDVNWNESSVNITIKDDGPGFSSTVLSTIGEPYISTRRGIGEHMGLGIFIAQTLLERSGASLQFSNEDGGKVAILWPRAMLEHGSGNSTKQ